MAPSWLWVAFTIAAAGGQTARNAMQRELTATLGTVGATHVRFLFGFPFALLFLITARFATGEAFPTPNATFAGWIGLGALTQIAGTALMLATMETRTFVVTIAYLKTEPIIVAVLAFFFLGDSLTWPMTAAILIATLGVVLISLRGGEAGGWKPALFGLSSGGLFAISAIGYRGGILALHEPNYVMAATFALCFGLLLQSVLLSAYLAVRNPATLRAIFTLWRPSMLAGFMGAAASEGWFLAFALAAAASVRTLGLIDVLFAQITSHLVFRQKTTAREAIGIMLLIAGAILLVWVHK
jgi:drug/metabolite transporter (DMT)-like permease